MKHTKIVATIGPASEKKTMIIKMMKAGMNVARLNFSHGTYRQHSGFIRTLRLSAKEMKTRVAIIQDLQGPRIRIGEAGKNGIKIKSGETVILASDLLLKKIGKVKDKVIPIQYHNLYKDIKVGDRILIDDANIQLIAEKIKDKLIYAKVEVEGIIKTHKGMNFPDSKISCPPVTEKDLADADFGVSKNVDFMALSFVKSADDVIKFRKYVYQLERKYGHKFVGRRRLKEEDFKKDIEGTHTGIIVKVERREAVEDIDRIIEAADGIMVARGDLGIEIPFEELPLIQKMIIEKCRKAGKPVIVATQMLDSMIRNPIPTRAEVSDVANAILDGTDAIMLSGESASGKYPLKAVQTMTKIAKETEEKLIVDQELKENDFKNPQSVTQAIGFVAQDIAEEVNGSKLIVCATISGFTARNICRFRTRLPIIAITPSNKTANQLVLSWGVTPIYSAFVPAFNQLLEKIKKIILAHKLANKNSVIVVVAGHPFGYKGQSNLIKIETV